MRESRANDGDKGMSTRTIVAAMAGFAAMASVGTAAAQTTTSRRPVIVQPPVGEVVAPAPPVNPRSGAPGGGSPAVVQVKPGVLMKRVYPAYVCSVGVLSASAKAKNPALQPTFYDVEFSPVAENLYHSNGMVFALNQFSFRTIENAGVVEFRADSLRTDYVKAQGEIMASWVQPMKWTVATGQIEGVYAQYWFLSSLSGTCRTK
jgi:hypothetical protein